MSGRLSFSGGLMLAGIIVTISAGQPALAEILPRQSDFSARRIGLPKGEGPRITVQIDPEEQARRLAVLPRVAPKPDIPPETLQENITTVQSDYGWYWDLVPAGARDVDLPGAVAALSQGPGGASVRAPRLQHLQEIAFSHGKEILRATLGTKVSPALVVAMIGVESSGRVDAVSHAGAEGLMQLIPATAARFGVADAQDPAQNIRGGVAYLDWLMGEFDHDPLMVVAAYNAGEGAVKANGGVPPYAETRDYVPKVLAAWQVAQGLCLSAPELISDPCVFKVISSG
ncbi:MAG: lytic transglycosylase domain-containing protein [Pseudorhodobacter sp.]